MPPLPSAHPRFRAVRFSRHGAWGRFDLRVALCVASAAVVGACDGAEPLQLPPVVSVGADRRGVENTMINIGEGLVQAELWAGPVMERWDDLLSITVFVRGRDDARYALGVEDGSGRVLIDANASESSPNRALAGWGIVMAQLPVASAAMPLAPPYKVKVKRLDAALPAEAVGVRVWTKHARTPGVATSAQELVVQVINAGGQVEARQLDRALDRARQIWRQGGVELTEAARTSLDDHVQPGVAHLKVDPARGSDSPAVKELLKLSTLALGEGLPLFLVQDIQLGDAGGTVGELWALSGGIPVPPLEGTARSGVAISAGLLQRDPHFAGQVLAHEIGHALGLFHTTEAPVLGGGAPRTLHDGLADTAECPAAADINRDQQLSSSECHAHDAANLMFWGTPRGAITLSPEQADVARRSMLVR